MRSEVLGFLKSKSFKAQATGCASFSIVQSVITSRPEAPVLQFLESNVRVTGIGAVGADGVGQNEGMLAILVLEEVVNALRLHQAADEIEICLAILNAIFARDVTAGKAELVIVEAVALENLFDNVRGGFGLENAAIGRAGEEPEPRDNRGAILGVAALVAGLDHPADEAVEIPFHLLADVQPDGDVVADDLVENNVCILAAEFRLDLEEASQLFLDRDRAHREHVSPKGVLMASKRLSCFSGMAVTLANSI